MDKISSSGGGGDVSDIVYIPEWSTFPRPIASLRCSHLALLSTPLFPWFVSFVSKCWRQRFIRCG